MTDAILTFRNGRIFDGTYLRDGHIARFENGQCVHLGPVGDSDPQGQDIDLGGDILFPGFVDLQVNGGDGILFNADPSVDTLRRIARAHRGLGVTAFLPTLITDTRDITQAAISAAEEAIATGAPGIAGLHLEGPHLSMARKGAHDADLIRPMEDRDLDDLIRAAQRLPLLKTTIAPESVSVDQVRALVAAGILVSLGHTDANYATCRRYFDAGATCVTHLFNAMSQLGNREPGLVGATMASGTVHAGLIADGVHVHPETIAAAWRAKTGPGRIFLVSDAMAVAGSTADAFELNGRLIRRKDGILTLRDGTLAGADLELAKAVDTMANKVGIDPAAALQAATSIPAALIGLRYGFAGLDTAVRLSADFSRIRDLRAAPSVSAVT